MGEQVVPQGKIHILYAGTAFCGTVPRDWPSGDVWVDITETDKSTCETCIERWNQHGHKYTAALRARRGLKR